MKLRWDGGSDPAKLGVMVCGHGSRNRKAVAEFAQLTTGLARLLPHHPLAYGYLEFAHPVIPAGLDRLRSAVWTKWWRCRHALRGRSREERHPRPAQPLWRRHRPAHQLRP